METVIVFPGALGDFLLALPALRALCRRHAGGRTTVVMSGGLVPLARMAGVGDDHADLDAASSAGIFGGTDVPAWILRRPRIYSWLGATDATARARLTAFATTVVFHRVVRDDATVHAASAYAAQVGIDGDLEALASMACILLAPEPELPRALARVPCPRLVIHSGAGARRKCWAPDGFSGIAARWRGLGGAVIEVVGPAEPDGGRVSDADLVVREPLPVLAAVLATADAYLGNDSGVSHLAGAVGARGAVVFGATRPERWRPLGVGVVPVPGGSPDEGGIDPAESGIDRVWTALLRAADLDNPADAT